MSDAAFWGVFGTLLGTLAGAASSWGKEWLFGRNERTRQARYLAVRITCILDDFVLKCFDVVTTPDISGAPVFLNDLPGISSFPDDLDWRTIEPDLAYQVLSLPTKSGEAKRSVEFILTTAADSSDDTGPIEEREYQYATVGLKAENIADRLRAKYGLPRRDDGGLDCGARFRGAIAIIEETRNKRAVHRGQSPRQIR